MKDEALRLALEALEHCRDAIIERGLGGNPDFAKKWGLTLPLDRSNKAITAIKQARALDKKAENARELGLDYEPVQQPFCFYYVENGEEYFAPKGAYVPDNAQPLYTTPPAQPAPVQEPVMFTYKEVADTMNALWNGTLKQVQIATELANTKLYTTPPAQPAVPEGWKLVPVEPTKEMAIAYWQFNDRQDVRMIDAWKAMLEAAPEKGQP